MKTIVEQYHFPFEDALFNAKVDRAVSLLRGLASKDYAIMYSGGKDSDVILKLCRMAGLERRPVYHVTTIDPPEVVQHVREVGAAFDHPGTNFYRGIGVNGLPTRWRRWCCKELKHNRVLAAFEILGVRKAESPARKARWKEVVVGADRTVVCPIVDWSADDVWRFVGEACVTVCSLYAEGHKRLGCIGCPLSRGSRIRDFKRWPGVGARIKKAFFEYGSVEPEKFWDDWVNDLHGLGKAAPCSMELGLWS